MPKVDEYRYRILNKDYRLMYTGEGNSYFTLEQAKKLVNRIKGEKIYEYRNGERLWEIL